MVHSKRYAKKGSVRLFASRSTDKGIVREFIGDVA